MHVSLITTGCGSSQTCMHTALWVSSSPSVSFCEVLSHTPTLLLDSQQHSKPLFKSTWIAVLLLLVLLSDSSASKVQILRCDLAYLPLFPPTPHSLAYLCWREWRSLYCTRVPNHKVIFGWKCPKSTDIYAVKGRGVCTQAWEYKECVTLSLRDPISGRKKPVAH